MLLDIFGGILLGTGGLVKAYSDAAKLALENTSIVEKEEGYVLEAIISYDDISDFEHLCKQSNIRIIDKEFTEIIKFIIEISKETYKKILNNNFHKMEIKIVREKYITK